MKKTKKKKLELVAGAKYVVKHQGYNLVATLIEPLPGKYQEVRLGDGKLIMVLNSQLQPYDKFALPETQTTFGGAVRVYR